MSPEGWRRRGMVFCHQAERAHPQQRSKDNEALEPGDWVASIMAVLLTAGIRD